MVEEKDLEERLYRLMVEYQQPVSQRSWLGRLEWGLFGLACAGALAALVFVGYQGFRIVSTAPIPGSEAVVRTVTPTYSPLTVTIPTYTSTPTTSTPTPTATYTPRPTLTPTPYVIGEYPERDAQGNVWLVKQWSDGRYTKNVVITPTPKIAGNGDRIGTDELEVQLVDYIFRPKEHPEKAAVEYTLRFVNKAHIPIEVQFALTDLTGYDNRGIAYGDYYAISKRAYDKGAVIIIGSVDWPKYLERNFTLQPGKEFIDRYLLNKESAGWEGRSRVDIDTDWIEIRLLINYRSSQLNRLNTVWRLSR